MSTWCHCCPPSEFKLKGYSVNMGVWCTATSDVPVSMLGSSDTGILCARSFKLINLKYTRIINLAWGHCNIDYWWHRAVINDQGHELDALPQVAARRSSRWVSVGGKAHGSGSGFAKAAQALPTFSSNLKYTNNNLHDNQLRSKELNASESRSTFKFAVASSC